MKRKLLNLVMLVIVVALAIGVYFASRPKPKPVHPPLTALNSAAITSIEIDRPKHDPIKLEKKNGHWRFTAPIRIAADDDNVNSILAVATSPCQKAIDKSAVSLSDIGLDPPKYSLRFGKTQVKVGMVEPLKYRRYVETGGKICLVSNPSAPGLGSEDYANLVSRNVVPKDKTLTAISIPGYTVKRAADGKSWTLAPADPKATKDAAEILADAWTSAHSMWNKMIPPGSKPPDNPEYATLRFKDGSQIKFLIAARSPQFKLERDDIGITYVLAKSAADTLLEPKAAPAPAPESAKGKSPSGAPASAGSAPAKAGQ